MRSSNHRASLAVVLGLVGALALPAGIAVARQTAGVSLREARVRQGLDYPQVELATKIRAKYIRALEEEEFEVLPSGTYIKGFMRAYADFLGLDGQLYVDEYNSRHVPDGFLEETPHRRP